MTDLPAELSVADSRRQYADVLNAASTRNHITYVLSRGRRVAAIVPVAVAEEAEERAAAREGQRPDMPQ